MPGREILGRWSCLGFPYLCVDLTDEDGRSAGGEVRGVLGRRLSFRRRHAAAQLLHVLEVRLGDAVVGRLAAVGRGDDPGRLLPLEVRHFLDQRDVGVGVVLLEGSRVFGVPVEHCDLHHWEPPFTSEPFTLWERLAQKFVLCNRS
jgi:hypothetical protein